MLKTARRLAFLVIALLAIVNSGRTLWEIYSRSRRLSQTRQEVESLREENARLQEQLSYSEEPAFVEDIARKKLNLIFPGEKILVLPRKIARSLSPQIGSGGGKKPNWQIWWEFIFSS